MNKFTFCSGEDEEMIKDPITEEWLFEVGFKSSQEERQPNKHWRINLATAIKDSLGLEIEVAGAWWKNRYGDLVGEVGKYHCWLIGDLAHKSMHIRHLKTQHDLILLVEALTGVEWNPVWHAYGNVYRPDNFPEEFAMITKNTGLTEQE